MSDLPPSRRDEREAELRDIEAFAKAVKDGALEARFAMPNIPTILGGLVGEIRLLSQQLDEAKADAEKARNSSSALKALFGRHRLDYAAFATDEKRVDFLNQHMAMLYRHAPASPRA